MAGQCFADIPPVRPSLSSAAVKRLSAESGCSPRKLYPFGLQSHALHVRNATYALALLNARCYRVVPRAFHTVGSRRNFRPPTLKNGGGTSRLDASQRMCLALAVWLCSPESNRVEERMKLPTSLLSPALRRSLFLPRRNVKPVFQAPGPPVVEFHAGDPSGLA